MLAEILRRIGRIDRPGYFVEFGAEHGSEGNCIVLADILGWRGLFIEGDVQSHARLASKYRTANGVLTRCALVTPGNVERLFEAAEVPAEFDVLSIDVDNQDWWIWRAISRYRPRVVIIEYNAGLPDDALLVVPEGFSPPNSHSTYFGASIGALSALGTTKGYRLVHTDLTGVNAFFVRSDQPGDWPKAVRCRGLNYRLRSRGHPPDQGSRLYVDVTPYLSARSH